MVLRHNKKDIYEELCLKLWDKFDDLMNKNKYIIFVDNDNMIGKRTLTFKEDRFVPMIEFSCWYIGIKNLHSGYISIHVSDRNG